MKLQPRSFFGEEAWFWAVAFGALALGLAIRFLIFAYAFEDNDEVIYHSLVDNIVRGKGYSLHGHPLLEQVWMSKAMYDSPVFFHPPVGIYFFWLVQGLVGLDIAGIKAAQLVCYVIFFLSGLGVLRLVFPKPSPALLVAFPVLLAFTPIYAHTNLKVWIDNPRLAFLMVHFFCCLLLVRNKGSGVFALAALTSFLSPFTKVDGLLALPFLYGAAWSLETSREWRKKLALFFGALLVLNGIGVAWWLLYSEALKYGPGRPSEELMAVNEFVRFATKVMDTRKFLVDYLKLLTTLVPSLIVIAACALQGGRNNWKGLLAKLGPRAFLFGWVLSHFLVYWYLAEHGYSKLIRYLLMTTPATLLLFAFAVEDLRAQTRRTWLTAGLAVLLFLAFQSEVLHGVRTLVFGTNDPMVYPVF